ncbi:hypothetical protein OOT55_00020 [Marinimicrobium sp. C6131]|uniref:hypothetical protein n=1 Tax=Marinimicrobium sp. C6131 TaxID=3022676 RepID=UPI00223DC44E|nr:hypothetical protein [Marinimicrobium sp. C6131]UZJ44482.1 hypothetical protein OOT55_00020 [Marinimicrobium sp. C6131]
MNAITSLSILFVTLLGHTAHAQFVDHFDGNEIHPDWQYFTGDGDARLNFIPHDGHARMEIDATDDPHNVWWSIIKRNVAPHLDMEKLASPDYELRIEARIRVSHAPRRVNFMINTQRTTDFHQHLREYDIPNTAEWHTISMTTEGLDAVPGDDLNVQLSATDWGPDQYHVDVDYYRADVVSVSDAEPDVGEPLVYHPPIPPLDSFSHRRPVDHDVVLNRDYPTVNFDGWHTEEKGAEVPVSTVSANQWLLLRWDLSALKSADADGAGVLQLTTQSVHKGGNYVAAYEEDLGVEFDKIRVFEVMGGPEQWDQKELTFQGFARGESLETLVNGQMVFDVEPAAERGGKTHITLSRPVMQRLLNGTTKGLLIRPLGALEATFYDSQANDPRRAPTLYFNLQ